MSKSESSDESPPVIFKETSKLLESMETNEDIISQAKDLLNQKQTYHEQLQQYEHVLNKSIAEKRANFSIINDRTSLIDTKTLYYRKKGKHVLTSYNRALPKIDEIKITFAECDEKLTNLNKTMDGSTHQYETKIAELTNLLDQLIERRHKTLEALERQEKKMKEENLELESQLMMCQKEDDLIDDTDSGDFENGIKELESKLSILNVNYVSLKENDESLDGFEEKMAKQFAEPVWTELETKSSEVHKEIDKLHDNVAKQKAIEQENVASYESEEYDRRLNEELEPTSKLWEDLLNNQITSRLDQEIDKIKADLVERKGKYSSTQEEKSKLLETLKNNNGQIAAVDSTVEQIATQLTDIQHSLEALKSSDELSQESNDMLKKINDVRDEKTFLEKNDFDKEAQIQGLINQKTKEKEKENLEITALENTKLKEIKGLEKQESEIEADKANLEADIKATEKNIMDLEGVKIGSKEKLEKLVQNIIDLDQVIEEGRKNQKTVVVKKEEWPKQRANLEVPREFVKPKTPETQKKSLKKTIHPKDKRNWDSDSSLEGEEVKLSDVLKKKTRRQQALHK